MEYSSAIATKLMLWQQHNGGVGLWNKFVANEATLANGYAPIRVFNDEDAHHSSRPQYDGIPRLTV